ncbi:MAG: hypothetical protein JNM07_01730 [Phycisphaerae bacterium]|nr:hypothetical protein [Phycisphaerae bacterium]
MRTTIMRGWMTAVLAGAGAAAPALADDLIPPPWNRFGPGTTAQSWDFFAGPAGGPPDGGLLFNPYGVPNLTPSNPGNWLPFSNLRNHVWAVNGNDPLDFTIPNDGPDPTAIKDVWLQVTYLGPAPLSFGINWSSSFGPAVQVGASIITQLADGWTHDASLWRFNGCPELERLRITPPVPGTTIFVDQVVIDTKCYVPAPGGLGLGAACGVVALRRRRRG